MSLAEFQRALCDLIASPELCLSVRADPTSTLAAYDLSHKEARRLEGVVRQRGMSTNCTLYRVNRVTPIYSILPLTCQLLGDSLLAVITDFWRARVTDLQTKHEVDLFAVYLRDRLADGAITDPYIEEVLSFEQAANTLRFLPRHQVQLRLEESPPPGPMPHPLVRAARFGHPPLDVLEPLAERRRPPLALPLGEYYLLLDARVEYADDLAVDSLEPELGRPLFAFEREGRPPAADVVLRLAEVGLVVGPGQTATVA